MSLALVERGLAVTGWCVDILRGEVPFEMNGMVNSGVVHRNMNGEHLVELVWCLHLILCFSTRLLHMK